DVSDDDLQAPLRAGRHLGDPGSNHDRACGSRRCELNEAQLIGDSVVVIGIEAYLVDVKSLGAVDVSNWNGYELEFHIHQPSLLRLILRPCNRGSGTGFWSRLRFRSSRPLSPSLATDICDRFRCG